MSKKFSLINIFLILLYLSPISQIQNPSKWFTEVEIIDPSNAILITKVKIEPKWHLYSQYIKENGPIPTTFDYSKSPNYSLIGKTQEIGAITKFDPVFEMKISFFENIAIFKQKINIKSKSNFVIKASAESMFCNDLQCLPPDYTDVEYIVNIADYINNKDKNTIGNNDSKILDTNNGSQSIQQKDSSNAVNDTNSKNSQIGIHNIGDSGKNSILNNIIPSLGSGFNLHQPYGNCLSDAVDDSTENKSYWWLFILGILGGLLAIITPCVYPMIPLTVSYFMKSSGNKSKGMSNAMLYGFFIILVYVLLSLPFHLFNLDPELLNEISVNPWVNMILFLVLVAFAISFFGYYEIVLPSKWTNKTDSSSNIGGIIGIFFMSLTLVLVSFSCTGPILGSVLAGVLKNGAWPLTITFLGFGIGLGLPFAIFAMFPSLLSNLPKSGAWLNSVKVILGFIEIALAMKFLSNVDFQLDLWIITREIFIGSWVLISILMILYLLGIIKFPHDSKVKKISIFRISLILVLISFVIYIFPGMFCGENRNRSLISGFPPPLYYSYCESNECALNLECYKDFQEGVKAAKLSNKPILLDFTGKACVNCREVEENIWAKENVYKLIDENYILISLYVDDNKKLPENEQGEVDIMYSDGTVKSKKIRTIGNKWATFETQYFNKNTQPLYALLSPDGTLLNNIIDYQDIKSSNLGQVKYYEEFLKCGIENYKSLKNDEIK